MSFVKVPSKFLEIPHDNIRLGTYTPKNEASNLVDRRPATNRLKTASGLNSPYSLNRVNESVDERLDLLLRVENPLTPPPRSMKYRVNTSQMMPTTTIQSVSTKIDEFKLRRTKKTEDQQLDVHQLIQSNLILQKKVINLTKIVTQLTTSQYKNISNGVEMSKSPIKCGGVSENSSKYEYSLKDRDYKYKVLFRQERSKTLQLEKQKHGLQVLLKLVRQQLNDIKRGETYSEQYLQLEREVNELQSQNMHLQNSLLRATSQVQLVNKQNKQLLLRLQSMTKQCTKFQKHNNLMLHSSHIIQQNMDQSKKKAFKDRVQLSNESFRKSINDKDVIARKDDQIKELLRRVRQLQGEVDVYVSDGKAGMQYDNKLRQISSKLVQLQCKNEKELLMKSIQFEKKMQQMAHEYNSKVSVLQNKLSEDSQEYMRQIEKFKESAHQSESKITTRENELRSLQMKYNQVQQKYRQNIQRVESAEQTIQHLCGEKTEIKNRVAQVEGQLSAKAIQIVYLNQEIDNLTTQNKSLSKSVSQFRQAAEATQNQRHQLQKEKFLLMCQKNSLIKQIITLKDQVSMLKINEFQAENVSSETNNKLQDIQQKHSTASYNLSLLTQSISALVLKYGYPKQSPTPSSDTASNITVQKMQWLQTYIDELRQSYQATVIQREQQEKQYIIHLNNKLSEVSTENSKLKQIMTDHDIDYQEKLEDLQLQRLKDSLNNTSKSDHQQLDIIKQESVVKQNSQEQRLQLIKRKLLQLQELVRSGKLKQDQMFSEVEQSDKGDSNPEKLMEKIEMLLFKIKKSVISKEGYYSTLLKNAEMQLSALKQDANVDKMRGIQSMVQMMTLRLIEQDQRIRQFQQQSKKQSVERSSSTTGIQSQQQANQNQHQTLQQSTCRKLSFNFKPQIISNLDNLQSNSQTRLAFIDKVDDLLVCYISRDEPLLYTMIQQLFLGLQSYPDHKDLFDTFERFLERFGEYEKRTTYNNRAVNVILCDYMRSASDMLDSENESENQKDDNI